MYNLKDYSFDLPKELIAQKPTLPRDHCKLLVYNADNDTIEHSKFYRLLEYLNNDTLFVFNDSSVLPARLLGRKKDSNGKVEVFLLKQIKDNLWQVMLRAKGKKEGLLIKFPKSNLQIKILERIDDQVFLGEFNYKEPQLSNLLNKIGYVPLPPYIKVNQDNSEFRRWLKKQYQTIYADKKKKGSVAAPTAGLHFTNRLLKKMEDKGFEKVNVTLHVGLGTFAPVRVENITQHKMHSELGIVSKEALIKILKAKKEGRKILSVGTTSVRVLEGLVAKYLKYPIEELNNLPDYIEEEISIFIYPGYKFKVVDYLITNFHLPESTLLMLVSALVGKENIDKLYKIAIEKNYKFFSFGDAMLLKSKNNK